MKPFCKDEDGFYQGHRNTMTNNFFLLGTFLQQRWIAAWSTIFSTLPLPKVCLVVAQWTACTLLQAQQPDNQDIVFMKSGKQRVGTVISIDNTICRLKCVFLQNQPPAIINIPRDHIDFITFARKPQDEAFLTPNPSNIVEHKRRWEEMESLLGIPNSLSGEFGLAYAEALLMLSTKSDAQLALAISKKIERESWNDAVKARAQQIRLRAMLALDDADSVIAEAEKLSNKSEISSVITEAKYILACAAESKLRQLEEEHPRWQEESWILHQRNKLYDQAIDLYLYAPLFHGSEIDLAARSLWGALQLYASNNDMQNATAIAQDLITLYSKTSFAAQAHEFMRLSSEHLNMK